MKISNIKRFALYLLIVLTLPFFCYLTSLERYANSAYEIAVKNGFVGSEQDWLKSLQGEGGESAYDIAVKNGFVGSEYDWLLSLQGASGVDGKDGEDVIEDSYSMYLTAKEKGEIAESTTYVEFLGMLYQTNDDYTTANLTKSLYSSVSVFAYKSKNDLKYSTSGSGVIYKIFENGDAYILTNYHVVYNTSARSFYQYFNLTIFGQDDNYIDAEVLGATRKYDIALLKVTQSEILLNSNAQEAQINETPVYLGQVCYSIGNTSEFGLSISRGIISVESETISMTIGGISGKFREVRHDSYTYHGNSGGGLFDGYGNLIGINNGGRENTLINYAIPANIIVSVANNLIKNITTYYYSQLKVYQTGIENHLKALNTISFFDSATSTIKIQEQITISSIDSNSLAADDGTLRAGDEVISIKYRDKVYDNYENYELRTYTLSELLISASIGDTFEITVKRNGEQEPTILTTTLTISPQYAITVI